MLPRIDDEPSGSGRGVVEICQAGERSTVWIALTHLALEGLDDALDEGLPMLWNRSRRSHEFSSVNPVNSRIAVPVNLVNHQMTATSVRMEILPI